MSEQDEYIELVTLIRAGHEEAYGELYEKTVTGVYRTVRFLIKEESDVEDVVQEIYIQAYRSLTRYDAKRAFRPWLMGVTMRQVQSYRRKRLMQFRFGKQIEKSDVGLEYDFSTDLVNKLANRLLLEQVHRLPYKLQQVVTLHYLNEYTQEEIAGILEIPLGTVKSRIHSALAKLRQKEKMNPRLRGKVEDLHETR
ncbi:sigma-70 family RNA polymerase sigma factor [Paenibacillus polymyxa]|uniref:sigma-70 family RNA polymerase sigma factor n=1 Tax=Paenibacillus polymyxa TaxID=1406 RepID=UPI001BEC23CE|nr:sigma-70 family RNA polymerase sigma factor [Paenibacillus polymyxa]MBT2283360.1 sigma-70 family RNA polymerase sigma factor [Paenibacillus polymyxa]